MKQLLSPYAKAIVYGIGPTSRYAPTPAAGNDSVDSNLQRHAWLSPTNGDGPAERVAIVALCVARLNLLTRSAGPIVRLDSPAGVQRAVPDRIAGADDENRRKITRESAVKVTPLR